MKNSNDRVKSFYDSFSTSYTNYANGTSSLTELLNLKESDTNRKFSWGDIQTWQSIEKSLGRLIEARREIKKASVRVLDVGCGDGAWALRIANYCMTRSVKVEIACLDLSPSMIELAKLNFNDLLKRFSENSAQISYEVCDLSVGLPTHIKSEGYDLVLCLHTVLNHLPAKDLTFSIGELVRASNGFLYFSVKPPFSNPTFYAAPMTEIIHFDRKDEHLYALDKSGGFHVLRSNLISHEQLQAALMQHSLSAEFIGLDILISRLTPDPRWVGDDSTSNSLSIDDLMSLEARVCRDSRYLNFANHILAVVDSRMSLQTS